MNQSWIAWNGPYQDYVSGLSASDPYLLQPDPKPLRCGVSWENRNVSIRAIEFDNDQIDKLFVLPLQGPVSLAKHLSQKGKGGKPRRTAYVFENMNRDVATVLGDHFRIHPSLFTNYERTVTTSSTSGGSCSVLTSGLASQQYLSMSPRILVTLPSTLIKHAPLRCSETGRYVSLTRVNGMLDSVGTVKRKCFIWNQLSEDGWTSIVICDPGLRSVVAKNEAAGRGHVFPVGQQPAEGAYVDFFASDIGIMLKQSPPKTSIADDLCFYLANYSSLPGLNYETPDIVSLFLQKIVASLYLRHLDQLRKTIAQSQSPMRWTSDFGKLDLAAVEANWSDCQTLERRLQLHCLDLEGILVQLRLPFERPDPREINSWQDVAADFQMLYHQYNHARSWVEKLNSSMTALAGIAGNRQAFREQQVSLEAAVRTRNITTLGLVFVPLAYVATLFSMSGDYAPGRERFWLYLVISIPMVLAVLGVYQCMNYRGSSGKA
ncbi:Uncharacterized protein LW93_3340 [Fusarium fujikuroi]|nr:Uncharacterized protein LW93_3340 [Fusarium fujikuroi]